MKIARWLWQPLAAKTLVAIVLLIGQTSTIATAQSFTPPGRGTPVGTAGGGSRPATSDCVQAITRSSSLLALAPTQFIGLTVNDRPTLWVYVPATTAKTLEFSLLDQEQNGIYQANIPTDGTAQLVKIDLPEAVPALAVGQSYYWTAALICNPQRRTEDWLTGGWMQRQAIGERLQRQLTGATLEQRRKLYAENGLWYETVNTLVQLRRSHPSNAALKAAWSELLQVGGLKLVEEPSAQSK
ncbi:MAG TPA: DUF928 domain-containing protein [Thermosynechococcaceae cyanobacterium]